MRTSAISAAVVAAIASASASAARIDVYVTGASAQRNFWNADIQALANCSAAPNIVKWKGGSVNNFGSPDFTETACTSNGGGELKMTSGDILAIHYSAELGSVMGVATALGHFGQHAPAGGLYPGVAYPANHLFLQWNAGDCTGTTETDAGGANTCGNGTIVYGLEASTVAQCPNGAQGTDAMCAVTPSIVSHAPDIALADLEPSKFENAIDWPAQIVADGLAANPAFKALGNAPSAANIAAITGGSTLNGQVFMIGLGSVPGNPQNLSSASISSIFQGNYTSWKAVPEVGAADAAGTPITICRRDNGSGTQVTSNATFTGGPECGLPGKKFKEATTATPTAGKVVLNTATSKIDTCLTSIAGSIGILGLQGNLNFAGVVNPTIDGVEANAHNAALGTYKYISETWGVNLSGLGAATTMLADAKTKAGLELYPGKETAALNASGTYHSAAPTGYYTLPIPGNGTSNTAANVTASPAVPNAAFTNGGDECALKIQNNVNTP
ncbi:MAG TPA: substrate-binding domain-containing protein [Steroidobacteraceae bacterium]|nr:substrate-binding domain-containing protein [Steroidobacteraceae bacterium]